MQIELNFERFVEQLREEWGPMSTPPKSVEEYVAHEAIERVVENVTRTAEKQITKIVDEEIKAKLEASIDAVIADRMKRKFQPMKYGEPQGEAKTIEDVITETIDKATRLKPKMPTYSSERSTLEEVIASEINSALARDLKNAVKEAKAEVLARVQKHAAHAMANAVGELAVAK